MRHNAQVANPAARARATEMTRDFQVKVFKYSVLREVVCLLEEAGSTFEDRRPALSKHYTLTVAVVRKQIERKWGLFS